MNWNIKELKDKVLKTHGKPSYLALSPSLNSLIERQEFTRYHYHEAKDVLEKHMSEVSTEKEIFQLAFSDPCLRTDQFEIDRLRARAHITGCIQSLHSVSDIFSHVIYHSLNLTDAKRECDITLHKVKIWLSKKNHYNEIKNSLDKLTDHQDYKYLTAISNYSKHRSIISINFQFNLKKTGKEMKELIFPPFTYDGKSYPSTPAYEFLTSEFDRESKLIIEAGIKLNRLIT